MTNCRSGRANPRCFYGYHSLLISVPPSCCARLRCRSSQARLSALVSLQRQTISCVSFLPSSAAVFNGILKFVSSAVVSIERMASMASASSAPTKPAEPVMSATHIANPYPRWVRVYYGDRQATARRSRELYSEYAEVSNQQLYALPYNH